MLLIILIFVVGLTPAIISAVMTVRAERLAKNANLAMIGVPCAASEHQLKTLFNPDDDLHYIEGMGYMVGDISCGLNARSPYLRCAVNPMGPCNGCSAYEPKVFERQY